MGLDQGRGGCVVGKDLELKGTLGRGDRKSSHKTQGHGPWCGKSREAC